LKDAIVVAAPAAAFIGLGWRIVRAGAAVFRRAAACVVVVVGGGNVGHGCLLRMFLSSLMSQRYSTERDVDVLLSLDGGDDVASRSRALINKNRYWSDFFGFLMNEPPRTIDSSHSTKKNRLDSTTTR
jgi:hypothetical protein